MRAPSAIGSLALAALTLSTARSAPFAAPLQPAWTYVGQARFVPNAQMLEPSRSPLPAERAILPSARHRPLIYLGDHSTGKVHIYDQQNGRQVGYLRTGHGKPWEIAVAPNGDVYVGNGDGTITAYHRHYYELFRTLHQPHCCASGLGFDPAGDLYANEYPSNRVDVFPPDARRPSTTFAVQNLASVIFMATDGLGNIFVDGLAPSGGALIDEISPPSYAVAQLQSLPQAYPGGLALDAQQNLIFSDQNGTLYTFAPPYTGSPTSSFYYGGGFGSSGGSYSSLALNAQENILWAAAEGSCIDNNCAFAQSNTYPLGGYGSVSTRGLYADISYGIAVDPPGAN